MCDELDIHSEYSQKEKEKKEKKGKSNETEKLLELSMLFERYIVRVFLDDTETLALSSSKEIVSANRRFPILLSTTIITYKYRQQASQPVCYGQDLAFVAFLSSWCNTNLVI